MNGKTFELAEIIYFACLKLISVAIQPLWRLGLCDPYVKSCSFSRVEYFCLSTIKECLKYAFMYDTDTNNCGHGFLQTEASVSMLPVVSDMIPNTDLGMVKYYTYDLYTTLVAFNTRENLTLATRTCVSPGWTGKTSFIVDRGSVCQNQKLVVWKLTEFFTTIFPNTTHS